MTTALKVSKQSKRLARQLVTAFQKHENFDEDSDFKGVFGEDRIPAYERQFALLGEVRTFQRPRSNRKDIIEEIADVFDWYCSDALRTALLWHVSDGQSMVNYYDRIREVKSLVQELIALEQPPD